MISVCWLAQGCRVRLCDRCVQFTTWAGLTFNAQKCGSLCAINNVSPTYVDTTSLRLGNDTIPALTWRQRYKYLGCPVGAGSSQDVTTIRNSLLRDCELVSKSQLAEWQKLDAYHRFLFPRLTYMLKIFFQVRPGAENLIRGPASGSRKLYACWLMLGPPSLHVHPADPRLPRRAML